MTESPSSSPGLLSRIAQSAEYSIAAALLLVCAVVGASLWWLSPPEQDEAELAVAEHNPAAAPAADEREALDEAQRRLGERFSALDEQQRRRTAEEESRRERQRAEAAAVADARREAELAVQARQQAEARAREPEAAPRAAVPAAPASVPKRVAEIVDAAIDWSSCRRPQYPAGSVRRSEEGVVVIAADLDAAANIRQTRVAQSSGFETLDRATLEAVSKCRFSPAREDGVAKAAVAQVRFTWKLQK